MVLLKSNPVMKNWVVSGLLWAAGFMVLFPLLMWVGGNPVEFTWVLVVTSVVAGLAWGFLMQRLLDRKERR